LLVSFGFDSNSDAMFIFVGLSLILQANFWVEKLVMIYSRRAEYNADRFSFDCGFKKDLIKALYKLQLEKKGLFVSNHLYNFMIRSHPLIMERIRVI